MRKLGFSLLALALGCTTKQLLPHAAQGAPVLEVRGAIAGGPHPLGRADLERLPRTKLRAVEPGTGRAAVWEGTPLQALAVDHVELRRGVDTVVVRTADGAAIPVPLGIVRQLQPVLADRVDGVRIAANELAWPTADQRGLATDPRATSWWARGVVALELVDWQRTYGPALAAPEGAADAARRGAGVYAESCISCHRLRGQGGERGPDLTTVAARIAPQAFESLLPSHPGWKERRVRDASEEPSAEIWEFLRMVAAAPASTEKTAPDEATAERR
jgi:mono/diheme cytochrome c family protein